MCKEDLSLEYGTFFEFLEREANKPALADAIWGLIGHHVPVDNVQDGSQYVLDGGALLQHIPWSHGSTYKDIICHHQYTDYVQKKYGKAVVVFDGYESSNTKDITHQRLSKGKLGTTEAFTADMIVTMKKEQTSSDFFQS